MFNVCSVIYISFFSFLLLSDIQYNFGEFQCCRHRANAFFMSLSCDRELNSPKLYRGRSLISLEKHFTFRYSPGSAIARACLVPRQIIHSQRVKPEIVVRVSIDRAIFRSARVVGSFKMYRVRFKQKEASRIKQSTIKNIIYKSNVLLSSKQISS